MGWSNGLNSLGQTRCAKSIYLRSQGRKVLLVNVAATRSIGKFSGPAGPLSLRMRHVYAERLAQAPTTSDTDLDLIDSFYAFIEEHS